MVESQSVASVSDLIAVAQVDELRTDRGGHNMPRLLRKIRDSPETRLSATTKSRGLDTGRGHQSLSKKGCHQDMR